jgi:hypothetical protein
VCRPGDRRARVPHIDHRPSSRPTSRLIEFAASCCTGKPRRSLRCNAAVAVNQPECKLNSNPIARTTDLGTSDCRVAEFEATASSSRTRVQRDDQYQRVRSRARGSPHRVLWWHRMSVGC